MSQYLKAVVAAIVTGVAAVLTVIQTANSDGEITGDERNLIITAIVSAVITVYGVYKARNTPKGA